MDYNAHSAQQLHRQRSEELARITELRRRSSERDVMLGTAILREAEPTGGAWHRILVRWHLSPRLAH